MFGSLVVAGYFTFVHDQWSSVVLADYEKLLWGTLLTTLVWLVGTLLTPAESDDTLKRFVDKVKPGGPGWRKWSPTDSENKVVWSVPRGMLSMALASIGVYAALFATGSWLYDEMPRFWGLAAITVVCTVLLLRINKTRK